VRVWCGAELATIAQLVFVLFFLDEFQCRNLMVWIESFVGIDAIELAAGIFGT
jgi:hypothetical protein